MGLIQETHNLPMTLPTTEQAAPTEDDQGMIQQVSGGFGNSNALDPEAIAIAFSGE